MSSSAGTGHAVLGQPHGKGGRRAWRTVNITPAERAGRIAVGLAAVAVGCTLMMALMMRGMGHGGGDDRR